MISDSCSATTLFEELTVENIFAFGSSSRDELSYSHGRDSLQRMSKTDKFSYLNYNFLNYDFFLNKDFKVSDLMKKYSFKEL